MIQSIMLLALGFLLATLISLLLAPVVWRRAARLATKKLKASLPISLTDFHAEKDQLRAKHAMEIRGLEVSLEAAKEKTAQQMVEIGRQRAENMSLTGQIRELRSALSERKSLISVMEQTLNANVPRMKERMETELGANIQLNDTVVALEGTLKKTTHQLEEADRDIKLREAEILKLRQAVRVRPHANAVFPLGRGRKGGGIIPENVKDNLDLADLDLQQGDKGAAAIQTLQQENAQLRDVISQTKEQLKIAKDFETKEVPVLRQELRQLGAEVLRVAEVPKIETQQPAALAPKLATAGKKPVLGGNLSNSDKKRAKRSLADRLKSVSKLGGQVDA